MDELGDLPYSHIGNGFEDRQSNTMCSETFESEQTDLNLMLRNSEKSKLSKRKIQRKQDRN